MSAQQDGRGLPSRWILFRDVGLFFLGAGIAVQEVVWQPTIRDSVLVFAGTLLGTPAGVQGLQSVAEAIRSRGGTGSSSSSDQGQLPSGSASP